MSAHHRLCPAPRSMEHVTLLGSDASGGLVTVSSNQQLCQCQLIATVLDEAEKSIGALPAALRRSREDGAGGMVNGGAAVGRAETFVEYVDRERAIQSIAELRAERQVPPGEQPAPSGS